MTAYPSNHPFLTEMEQISTSCRRNTGHTTSVSLSECRTETVYRIDDELVGISVIDILPLCVSSVYFIWNPDYAWASLGKLSALRELALARDIRKAGAEQMGWVYMGMLGTMIHVSSQTGYWVPGCGKMMYKSEYNPSYLLDPVRVVNSGVHAHDRTQTFSTSSRRK